VKAPGPVYLIVAFIMPNKLETVKSGRCCNFIPERVSQGLAVAGMPLEFLRHVPGIRFAVTDARFGLLATDGGDVLLFWLIPALLRITSGRHFAADYCCVVTSRAAFFAISSEGYSDARADMDRSNRGCPRLFWVARTMNNGPIWRAI
jgi:hypothetical protein